MDLDAKSAQHRFHSCGGGRGRETTNVKSCRESHCQTGSGMGGSRLRRRAGGPAGAGGRSVCPFSHIGWAGGGSAERVAGRGLWATSCATTPLRGGTSEGGGGALAARSLLPHPAGVKCHVFTICVRGAGAGHSGIQHIIVRTAWTSSGR